MTNPTILNIYGDNHFVFSYTYEGVDITHGSNHICHFNWDSGQHKRIRNGQNILHKYIENTFPNINDDVYQLIQNSLIKQQEESEQMEIVPETNDINPNTEIETWQDLATTINTCIYNREKEFKLVLSVILSLYFSEGEYIYLCFIAPPGIGKSAILKSLPKGDFCVHVDDVTLEGFAPGNQDGKGLLDLIAGMILILHDITALISGGKDKRLKFFGMLTGAYDKEEFNKFSPFTGLRGFGANGGFNMIFGITPPLYFNKEFGINQLMSRDGRFLIYKLNKIDQEQAILSGKHNINRKLMRETISGFLINKMKEINNNIIKITDETKKYIIYFMKMYVKYINTWKSKDKYRFHNEYETQGFIRPYSQMLMLCKAKCIIEGKDSVTKEDFNFFAPLFWGVDKEEERINKLICFVDISDLDKFVEICKMWQISDDLINEAIKKLEESPSLDESDLSDIDQEADKIQAEAQAQIETEAHEELEAELEEDDFVFNDPSLL